MPKTWFVGGQTKQSSRESECTETSLLATAQWTGQSAQFLSMHQLR